MRGSNLIESSKWWNNLILREWIVGNIYQDDKEEDNKQRLNLLAVNPQLYKELEKPTQDNLEQETNRRLKRKTSKPDPKVIASMKKYEKVQKALDQENDFSLKDEKIDERTIDAAADHNTQSGTPDRDR